MLLYPFKIYNYNVSNYKYMRKWVLKVNFYAILFDNLRISICKSERACGNIII